MNTVTAITVVIVLYMTYNAVGHTLVYLSRERTKRDAIKSGLVQDSQGRWGKRDTVLHQSSNEEIQRALKAGNQESIKRTPVRTSDRTG